MRTVELAVIVLRRDGLRAVELKAELDEAVFGGDVVADDARCPFTAGLPSAAGVS